MAKRSAEAAKPLPTTAAVVCWMSLTLAAQAGQRDSWPLAVSPGINNGGTAMKRTWMTAVSLLLVSVLGTTTQARNSDPQRPRSPTNHKPPAGPYGSATNPRLEYLHNQCQRLAAASCHPSRAAVLAKTLAGAGTNSAYRPETQRQLAVLIKHLPAAERNELKRIRLIETNYQKYQQQRAKKLPATGGTDRPRDPWLDILAKQQAERNRKTVRSDP
jgi:hypothetical protein